MDDVYDNDHLNSQEYLELDERTTLVAWLQLKQHSLDPAPMPPMLTMRIQADATQIIIAAHDPATRKDIASINIEFTDGKLLAAIFNVDDEKRGIASTIAQLLSITDGNVGP